VVDPGNRPLAGLVPELMANELKQRLAAKGVAWRFGVTLQTLDHDGDEQQAVLSDGSVVSTGLILSAAGLIANTELAKKSGLQVDVGIAVNSDMRTSNGDVYAIGDCASVNGRLFAYIEPIRRQAEAIAADLMGEHERFMPIPPMVKIKTQSMPMSVCRPAGNVDDAAWQFVSNDVGGCHFEMVNDTTIVGFALSDALSSDAGSHYRKLSV
jgi:rubredoxin-NAD+ reductase